MSMFYVLSSDYLFRRIRPVVFFGKGVLKICSKCKFTGEHPCRSVCCMFSEHVFLRTPVGGCFCLLTVLKGRLAGLRQFLTAERPLKMM